jgi:hypothetical protein
MIPKQDRVRPRTPTDLEHKYSLGELSEINGIANDAQRRASDAQQQAENALRTANEADEKLSAIADYIVEQGTSGAWTYRKWASGSCELWCTYQNTSVTDGMAVVPLPFPIQAKSMLGFCVPGDYYSNASLSNHYGISQSGTDNVNIYVRDSYTRNTNGTVAYCNIYIKAIWT